MFRFITTMRTCINSRVFLEREYVCTNNVSSFGLKRQTHLVLTVFLPSNMYEGHLQRT